MDLLGEYLTQRATKHGEVLAEEEHLATIDRAPPGDHTVGVGMIFETSGMCPVAGQHVEFVEAARVEQILDAFASQHLAFGMLAFNGTF